MVGKKYKGISVRLIANTRLNPKQKEFKGKLYDNCYPAYIAAIYNRQNTRIKVDFGNIFNGVVYIDADFVMLKDKDFKKKINEEIELVEKVIYLESKANDDYKIAGLSNRLSNYRMSMVDSIYRTDLMTFERIVKMKEREWIWPSGKELLLNKLIFLLKPAIFLKSEKSEILVVDFMFGDGAFLIKNACQSVGYNGSEVEFYFKIFVEFFADKVAGIEL